MAIWDGGFADQPEGEREGAWHDPDDEDSDEWRGGEPVNQGDEWKTDGWRYWPMSPEERMWRDLLEDEDDEGG